MKSQRRLSGGRYLARVLGALRGGEARLSQPVGQPANPEADGATRARVDAKEGQPPRVGKFWDLAFGGARRVDWSQKVSS